ncbi:MAG TPA: peptidylprolyl isomerase [Thermoleophilaceae bacterium]
MAPRTLITLLCLFALPLAGCGSDDDQSTVASKPKPICKQVEPPPPKPDGGQQRPSAKLSPQASYDAVLATSCGTFTIHLDQKQSPNASASFAALVRAGFYDDTSFHRIVPGVVIQGGDPLGTGTGGPGYSTRDKPPADARYSQGVVAMAKAGNEPSGTAGSQFVVVTAPDAGLPPDYAIIGTVTKGMDVVRRIARLGDPASGGAGTPKRTVLLDKATLDEQ